ncbi:MAG: recombinase family protein, partial [Planctomycetales bacterium]
MPIFGIIKPLGAKNDAEWRKDPDAEPIYAEWFARLDREESYADIADWLNSEGVPTGLYSRMQQWDGRMVARVTHNPILKGYRYRNKRTTRRNIKGKYVPVKADPSELRLRPVPHLAFFDSDYYDRVVAKADERNAKYRRGKNGQDARRNVPKKRTRFPGQTVYCGVCGRLFVFGGHGHKDHLMCTGAREHRCWNGATIDGPFAAEKIATAVLAELEKLPEFDEAFVAAVNEEALRLDADRTERLAVLDRDAARLEREVENLVAFVRHGDSSERIRAELGRLEEALRLNRLERQDLEKAADADDRHPAGRSTQAARSGGDRGFGCRELGVLQADEAADPADRRVPLPTVRRGPRGAAGDLPAAARLAAVGRSHPRRARFVARTGSHGRSLRPVGSGDLARTGRRSTSGWSQGTRGRAAAR